jgi:hypothetical protein
MRLSELVAAFHGFMASRMELWKVSHCASYVILVSTILGVIHGEFETYCSMSRALVS